MLHDTAHFKIYAGHYGIDLGLYLETELSTISLLRDPLQRTLSHYLHVHRDTSHPYHWRVSRQSFDVFIQDAQNWPMIENFQARYLVASGLDMRSFTHRLDLSPEKLNRLSTTSEDVRYLLDRNYVRERACETLDRIDVLGTTTSIKTFLERIAYTFSLNLEASEEVPRENVATNRWELKDLSQSSIDLVSELTAIDQLIFEIATARELVSVAGPALPLR